MYDEIISFDNLYKALKQCCKGVRWKDSTIGYENNALINTYNLRQSLLNNTYKISRYQKFKIYEPKERDILATRIKDRQFQRSLCDNGFYEAITKSFITDNCACRKGMGVDYALNRMTKHLRAFYINKGNSGWVLKCDIHHYFPSINHDIAKTAVAKRVNDEMVVYRVDEIIDSFGNNGIGLGSQVSQLIALAYLDDLDHFIKEQLHIKYYIRYMDDFILIHEDREYLLYCWREIENKLSEIGLELNKKTSLQPLNVGFRFLQWKFILTDTGRVVKKINRKKLTKEKKKLRKLYSGECMGINHPGAADESLNSFLGNAKRGNTFYEQEEMIRYFELMKEEVNMNTKSLVKRVADLEAFVDSYKSNLNETLVNAYNTACADHEEDQAAYLARQIRNHALDKTDKEMSLDRVRVSVLSESALLQSLESILCSEWAKYRQELRDLPEQEGFPFDIVWPESPLKKHNTGENKNSVNI